MRDAALFASHMTGHPNLDGDGHRSPPDFLHTRITADRVPHSHRLQERHAFHRRCDHARLSSLRRKNSTAQVHLRGHPASENVAIRICVLRHGDRLNHQLAFGFVGHKANLARHSERSRGIPMSSMWFCHGILRLRCASLRMTRSQDQHAIAVTVETIVVTDRFLVHTKNEFASSKRAHQHQ